MVHLPKFHLLIIIVLVSFLFNGFCQSDTTSGGNRKASIAIFPCRADKGITITEVSFITEKITLEILRQDLFKVIDKYEIAKRTGNRDMGTYDTISNVSTYFDLGAKCGADKIVWGSLARKGSVFQLDLHLGSVPDRQPHDSCSTAIIGSTLELSEQVPLLLGKLFHLAVTATASSSTAGVPNIVYAPIPQQRPIRLTVRSIPEGARVYLNDAEVGVTPYVRDSLRAGVYICRIEAYGYAPFSERIAVSQNDDKKMLVYLEKVFGSLTVNSTPAAAAVTLSNSIAGHTPFTCDTLRAGTYTLHLMLDGYAPYQQTVSIASKKNDTVSLRLVSLKYLDSMKQVARRKNQLIRRIGFGTLTAGFFGTSLYYNMKAQESINNETSAYNAYKQLNSSNTPDEFSAAYDKVQTSRKDADSYRGKRNVFYVLSAVFCAGLGISIKF
jgi:hypothetical protein